MNSFFRVCPRRYAFCLLAALFLAAMPAGESCAAAPDKVLASTFPMALFTANVARGSRLVRVELMLPARLGCPHDYALSPQDMQKLADARLIIINGLGMEDFLTAALQKSGAGPQLVDSSAGMSGILYENGRPDPHLFANPRLAAMQVMIIARALAQRYPEERELFLHNARDYAARLNELAAAFQALGRKIGGKRIVAQHNGISYLANETGLTTAAVISPHHDHEPSASRALELVKLAKERQVAAILVEPQYPEGFARKLARECGVPLIRLDPVANGPDGAPPDYYERVMQNNLKILAETLGNEKR